MNPATANLLLIVLGGPAVMGGTFAVASALVHRHDKPLNQELGASASVKTSPPARRPETIRPPRRKELAR